MVLSVAQQHIGPYDAYDAAGVALAATAGLMLAGRALVLRSAGRRTGRGGLHELLVVLMVTGLVIVVLHQTITDGLCHGSCSVTSQHGPGRHG